jgi:hypothetical protein
MWLHKILILTNIQWQRILHTNEFAAGVAAPIEFASKL